MAARHPPSRALPRRSARVRPGLALALCLPPLLLGLSGPASAQVNAEIMVGMPQQVIPQADEVGLGGFDQSVGTVTIAGSGNVSTGSGSGSGDGSGSTDDSAAMDLMASTSWGMQAEQNTATVSIPGQPDARCVPSLMSNGRVGFDH